MLKRMKAIKLKQHIYNFAFSPLVLLNSKPGDLIDKYPVYIFHHIPKCAGTSAIFALRHWFFIVKDYWSSYHPEETPYFVRNRVKLQSLRSYKCLCGHFDLPETRLYKRYPEVLHNQNFKIFTFIRDPLEVKISLFYYEKKRGRREGISLEQYLLQGNNFIARVLDCTLDNYKEVLDSYFFIGITEHLQLSMDKLAVLLNKRKVKPPVLKQAKRDSQASRLPPGTINRFKARNELDYRVYDYCLSRFQQTPSIK
jgi:hypothetical protein